MLQLSNHPTNPYENIRQILEDNNVRRQAEEFLELLDPISKALNCLQSDQANIADGYFEFNKLREVMIMQYFTI